MDLCSEKISFGKGLSMDLSKHVDQPLPLCILIQGEFLINGQYLRNEKEADEAIEFLEFQKADDSHKYEEDDLTILT